MLWLVAGSCWVKCDIELGMPSHTKKTQPLLWGIEVHAATKLIFLIGKQWPLLTCVKASSHAIWRCLFAADACEDDDMAAACLNVHRLLDKTTTKRGI
jgi:hypothetical protein